MGGYTGYEFNYEDEELALADPAAAPAPAAQEAPPPAAAEAPPPQQGGGYEFNYEDDQLALAEPAAEANPYAGGEVGGYSAVPPSLKAEPEAAPPEAAPPPAKPEEQGPGFFERLGTGLTELPGNALDAVTGLFDAEEPPPAKPARDTGKDLYEQRKQREAAGAFIDSDVQGPGERLKQAVSDPGSAIEAAGGVKDDLVRWAGDVVEDPKGSLGAAKDALVEDGLRNFERGVDYSKNVINQDQAAILARELETGESGLGGWSPGDVFYANNPMRQAAIADPELGARMLDAYYQGYTREDGTYIEPGERAMQIAYYEPLDTGQKIKQDLYTDPFLIPATLATMGAAPAAQAAARIPKIGKAVAPLVRYGPEAIDTVGNLGLNFAVPKAVGGITKAGKAVGLFKPSASALDKAAVEQGFEAAEQVQQAMREAGTGGAVAEEIAVRTNPWNQLDYVPQTTYRTPADIPLTALTPGPGQKPLLRDVMDPMTGNIMPAGSPRLQWAVGHQRRFIVEQAEDGTSWFVKENLKGAPKWAKVFNLTGTEWARNPNVRDRVVSGSPMQDAINFAKEKTLEWQDRGLADPVTFRWQQPPLRNTPAAPRPGAVDEHAMYSRSVERTMDGRPIPENSLVADAWDHPTVQETLGGRENLVDQMAHNYGVEPWRVGRIVGLAERRAGLRTDIYEGEGAVEGATRLLDPSQSQAMHEGATAGWEATMTRPDPRSPYGAPEARVFADPMDRAVADEFLPLLRQMREHLDRYGLEQTDLSIAENVADDIGGGQFVADESVNGMFKIIGNRPRIVIAAYAASVKNLAGTDPYTYRRALAGTLDHEVIHAMKRADVFSPDEWDTLAQAANRMFTDPDKAIADFSRQEREDLNWYRPEDHEEEMVARLFEAFAKNQDSLTKAVPPGLLERALQIVNAAVEWLASIGRIAEEEPGAEDILRTIWEGGFAHRTRKAWHEEAMLDPGLLRPDGSKFSRTAPAWDAEDAYRWEREPYNWGEESREDLVRFMDENPDILHAPRLVDQGMPDPTGTIRRDPNFTSPMDRDKPWRALVANWFGDQNDGVQTMGIMGNIHEYERVEREFGPFVEQIRERIDRYGLDQVALEISSEVRIKRGPNAGTPVSGYWDAYDGGGLGTIAIAVGQEMQLAFNKLIFDVNVGEIVDHEVIHAMRSARAFSDEEWDEMVDAARRWTESDDASGLALDAREKVASSLYDVHDRDEERVANLFAAWNKNQTKLRHAMPSDIFDRIDRIFQAAWDFLNGFVSVLKNDPDVTRMFSDIAEGKYADKVRAGLALNAQDTANIPRKSPSPSSLPISGQPAKFSRSSQYHGETYPLAEDAANDVWGNPIPDMIEDRAGKFAGDTQDLVSRALGFMDDEFMNAERPIGDRLDDLDPAETFNRLRRPMDESADVEVGTTVQIMDEDGTFFQAIDSFQAVVQREFRLLTDLPSVTLYGDEEAFQRMEEALGPVLGQLRTQLDRFGMEEVGLSLSPRLYSGDQTPLAGLYEPGGTWGDGLPKILLSLAAAGYERGTPNAGNVRRSLARTLDHEVLHALRSADVLSDDDWSLLVRAARDYVQQGVGGRPGIHRDSLELSIYDNVSHDEEMVARLFSDWNDNRDALKGKYPNDAYTRLDRIINAVLEMLSDFSRVLKGEPAVERLLADIADGKYADATRRNIQLQNAGQMPRRSHAPSASSAPISGQPANKGPKVPMPPRYGRPKPYEAVRRQYTTKWEDLAQTVLPEDTIHGLDMEIHHNGLNRVVGEVMLEFRDEIDSLRRVAQGTPTRHSDGEIRSMEKRWNEVYGEPRDWAQVTDEQADDLVSYAVGQAIKGSRMVARGADANDVFAKGLRAVDKYLSYNRAIRLYGWAGGLQYIAMQGIGNAITGVIAKPSALPEYLYLNTKGLKAVKAWDQKTATPDQLPRLIKEFRRVGLMGNANIDTTFGTAFGVAGREGGPFNTPGSSQFKKNLGKLLAPRAIANDANARDLALRLAVGGAEWDKQMSALLRPLADNAVKAKSAHGGWNAIPVPESAIRERIARLKKDTGDRFTAAELRDALLELGQGLPRQKKEWNVYVDRVSRDYVNGLRNAQKAARDEVNRVAFPFQSTNADEVLSRLFMFHYWISRASVLYLNEAANNPWQLRSWMQAMEEANRQQEEQALPQWKSAFMKFMETPAGYAVHLDPTSLLGTYLFFAEQGGEKPMNDYTAFGRFFDDGPGGNLMLNPLIRAAVYVLGAGGADFKAGDITGTGKLERRFTDAMNLANSLGEGFIRSEGGEPVPVAEIDQRKFMAWLAQYTSGRLPGTTQVDPYQYDTTFARTALIYGISNQIVANDPDLKARLESPIGTVAKDAANQLEMATEEILLNPKHEYYRTAYDDYAKSNFLGPASDRGPLGAVFGAAVREVSPFRISTSIAEQDAARVRKKVYDAPTARDEEMGNLLWDTGDKRALNLAFERIGMNNWSGDFGVEALIAARNPGMSTTEILQLSAEARRDPDSAVMQEARRLNDAEGVVKQITGGAWEQGTLTVGGQSISQERLNALDSSDRWKWANAWLAEQGLLEAHEAFRQQKADFVKSEPLLQGWYGYKEAAEQYPGGFDLWVRDTARINPGFAGMVAGLEKNGFLPGTEQFKDAVMKTGAYLRAEGADQYGGRANGNGRYAGVPEGQSLASWKTEKGEEYDDNGYVAKKAEGILKDMKDVDAAFAKAEEYGYGEVFLMQLQTGDKDTYNLPYDVYQAVKQAAGGYVPSGKMSDVEGYVTWIRQQPKGTYASEEEAVKAYVAQARSAEDIGGELPQESTGGSGETAAGSLFSTWQGADPATLPATHEVQMAEAAASGEPVLLSGADYAYLRPAPGRDAGFVSVLAAGQAMTMLELVDVGGEKWARVQMPDGSEGYVLAAYVRR